jgi:hypothetical protein
MTADLTVAHAWNCNRPPLQDYYRTDPATGPATVQRRCPSCGAIEKPAEAEGGGST